MHLSRALAGVGKGKSKILLVPTTTTSNIKYVVNTTEIPSPELEPSLASNGTFQSLIIFLVFLFLCGIAVMIYVCRKKGYPASIMVGCVKCPDLVLPKRSVHKSSEDVPPAFSFARFSNARISHLNFPQSFEGFMTRTEPIDSLSVLPSSQEQQPSQQQQQQEQEPLPKKTGVFSVTGPYHQGQLDMDGYANNGYSNNIYDVMPDEDYKDTLSYCSAGDEHVYAVIEGPSDYEAVAVDQHYANIGYST